MRLIFETGKNFSTFLAARMIFVTVLLGLAVLFRYGGQSVTPYLTLGAINAVFSLICWEWFRRKTLAGSLRWVALTGAVIIDTLVLHFTGGADSEFVFLYFFSIGSAGLLTGLRGSLWTAVLSSIGILWLYREESARYLFEHGFHALFYAVNFLLTAFLTSYVFDKVREKERSHQRTLGELEQTRLDTQAILDSLSTGVLVVDQELHVIYSNPAGLYILNVAEAGGETELQSLLKPESTFGDAVRKFLNEMNDDTRREINLPISGGVRPIGFSSSSLYDVEGEHRGHIILFSDLTRIKEAERVDRERDRLASIGRLSRDLAHGIRNPLATVRGCVEMIQQGIVEGSETGAYLELALRESDRLNMLLRDFQKFANLDAPQKQMNDLAAIVRHHLNTESATMPVFDELPPRLETECDADQVGLAVDAVLLALTEWSEGKEGIRV
ncbi:MAG: histidine kinase dimerization/phospho-acceptor domain-containing protein, partial [Calditrichota bacterium]